MANKKSTSKKKNFILVRLVSSESDYKYTTRKRNRPDSNGEMPAKLKRMKYDPKVRKHVMFNEKKIDK